MVEQTDPQRTWTDDLLLWGEGGQGGDDRRSTEEPGCKVTGSGAGPEGLRGWAAAGVGAAERSPAPSCCVGRAEASLLEV